VSRVAIIDTGLCNLDSMTRAIETCGGAPLRAHEPGDLTNVDRLILPGVGRFGAAMEGLRARGLEDAIKDEVAAGTPLLGVCLGMQMLGRASEESEGVAGLGLIPGRVVRLQPSAGERVPHMGWNAVTPQQPDPLFAEIQPDTDFYFVHSYHFVCDDNAHAVASTPYCGGFTSVIRKGAVAGAQFHPEKSQTAGFALLRAFLGEGARLAA
jgi:glutamine amidotransferase